MTAETTADASATRQSIIESPLGPLVAVAGHAGLERLSFDAPGGAPRSGSSDDPCLARLADELGEYFAGRRRAFTVPLAPRGTDFERRVWDELRRIPCGRTRSYADIARALGDPLAVRAVGRANGANPIAILIPCHRVIASDGSLHGYGGGLDRKRRLLELEGALGAGTLWSDDGP